MKNLLLHPVREIRTYGVMGVLRRPSVQRPLMWVVALIVLGALIQSNRSQADDIQSSREESVRRICESQNARHDKTITRLDEVIADKPVGSPERKRAEDNRAGTVLLIDALVPKQNCDKQVELIKE